MGEILRRIGTETTQAISWSKVIVTSLIILEEHVGKEAKIKEEESTQKISLHSTQTPS